MKQNDMRGRVPRRPLPSKLPLEFLLTFYEAFLREYEITKIAAALDLSYGMLEKYVARFPELAQARDLAIRRRGVRHSFAEYIFQHLSPEAQAIWEKIKFWESSNSAYDKINAILEGKSKQLRQELFIHAMVSSSWNPSEACRIVGVSRNLLERWKRHDLEFRQLIEEIQWHKRNFYEQALDDLVASGNPGAVMFVNRTVNADRGFNERIQLEHTGTIEVGFTIEDLDLDMDTRIKILDAIRRKGQNNGNGDGAVVEVAQIAERAMDE